MKNNLQKWFAAAADAEPIVKVEEVGAMINTVPRSVRVKPTFKHFIIMGASLILITSLVYWMNMPGGEVVKVEIEKSSLPQHTIAPIQEERTPFASQQIRIAREDRITTISRKETIEREELYVESNGQVIPEIPQSGTLDFQSRIIYLTEKDFEKLDIHFIRNGYNHYYKTYSHQQKVKATQLRSINDSFYFAKGNPGKNYFIKPWESDYHPLFLTDSLGNQQQNFHFQDRPENRTPQQFADSLRNNFLMSYNDLLPIAIRTSATGKLNILWYKPTRELFKQLPILNEAFSYGHQSSNQFLKEEKKIEKGEYIYLSDKELAVLGIRTDGNTLEYLNQYDKGILDLNSGQKDMEVLAIDIKVSASGGINSNNVHAKDSILAKYSNDAIPLIITYGSATNAVEQFYILNKHVPYTKRTIFVQKMKELLVPVVVKTKAKGILYKVDQTFTFWYKNEASFRSKLPIEYANHFDQFPDFNEEYLQYYIKELKDLENKEAKQYDPTLSDKQKAQSQFNILSSADLKKLGIDFNGSILDYKLFANTTDNRMVAINLLVTPDMYSLNYKHKSRKVKKLKWRDTYALYVTDSNLNITSNFIDPIGQIDNQGAEEEREIRKEQLFMQRLDSLVPVLVTFNPKAVKQAIYKSPQTHLVFWFPKSKEMQQVIRSVEDKEAGKAEVKETAINSIHYIELPDSVLLQMGISKEEKFIRVPIISTRKHLGFSKYSKSGSEHTFLKNADKDGIETTLPPTVIYPEPMLITDGTGLHWRLYQMKDSPEPRKNLEQRKEYMLKRTNTLIAIRVRSIETYDAKSEGNLAVHPDLIIWYDPDSLFLSKLPVTLAQRIKDELAHLHSNGVASSCTYFEACANSKEVVAEYMLHPNPAQDKSVLSFTLKDSRTVNISITDISGKMVKSIVSKQTFIAGKQEVEIGVAEMREGMYLVNIETDKGERITQRMVVRK